MPNCPHCGGETKEGDSFCKNCGASLPLRATPRRPRRSRKKTTEAVPRTQACPSCGRQIPLAVLFCPHCQAPIVEGGKTVVYSRPEGGVPPTGIADRLNRWASAQNSRTLLWLIAIILILITVLVIAISGI